MNFFEIGSPCRAGGRSRSRWTVPLLALMTWLLSGPLLAQEAGVGQNSIRIAGVMDLKGRARGLGSAMKKGIEAALYGQLVRDRSLEFQVLDDSYQPDKTVEAVNRLLGQEPFLFLGNVGTDTAEAALPLLARERVPAVGFFSGSEILRPGVGNILNFRASYVQETAAVIDAALAAGYRSTEICAYVQDDDYGMAGLEGVKRALRGKPGAGDIVAALDQVLSQQGANVKRNGIGPVGVYQRNTYTARPGYLSLKAWEQARGANCRLVVTTGTYTAIAKFIGYSRYKQEDWVFSAVSFTGADDFLNELKNAGVEDRVVMTQVVPLLDSVAPIVSEARYVLGDDFGYVSLEGFIVGKMLLRILDEIKGDISRGAFMKAALGSRFDLGGIDIDFRDDNQGSDLVVLTRVTADDWQPMPDDLWQSWRQ